MKSSTKTESLVLVVVLITATFFRLHPDYNLNLHALGGVLTVLGLYLLARHIFNWQIAAIASFLLATSFWHVSFSRMTDSVIFVPLAIVWAFYFLWRSLRNNHLAGFIIAGVVFGIGFYVHPSFKFASLITIAIFLNFWSAIKTDFDYSKYQYSKLKLSQGFAAFLLTTIVISFPIGYYFWSHQTSFLPQSFDAKWIGYNTFQTLFTPWPIGIFFAIGLIKEVIHWLGRKHGHFSTVHTFLLAWFIFMLLPGFLSTDTTNFSITLGVVPAIAILTARGIWWLFENINKWHAISHPSFGPATNETLHFPVVLALLILLASFAVLEFGRYFFTPYVY